MMILFKVHIVGSFAVEALMSASVWELIRGFQDGYLCHF